MVLSFKPLTPASWNDFETLFGERGACGGCWCMLWRTSRAKFESQKGAGNKAAMKALVQSGAEPGLLAYDRKIPVGWCAVAPRADYPVLTRSRILKPVDKIPVWSVSCLFVDKSYRNRGVSVELLRAAIAFVAKRGGTMLEGYPVEPKTNPMPAAFEWTGLASAFRQAGFKIRRRASETRPIMRFRITKESAT